MDIASIFLFCLMSLIIGAVLMLLIQYYAFVRYFNLPEETPEQKSINEKYQLPDNVLASLKSSDPESKYPIVALNLIMQFLYHELKNSNKVRKWFFRKLSLELDELITKTTTGKLFDKLTITDLDLGGQFPEIKNLRVHNADLHDTQGHIESLDLFLDLEYKGNFRLSIDADMVLGKKGSLTLKVKHLSGLARLQFTRKPYTHWSLAFLGDPKVELGVESQFQGRQMQSNVTSLIINQIRKAVRRKHTLPNYKIRYKPFFHKTEEEIDTEILPNGKLKVRVAELTRLAIPPHATHVYCTITLASIPWVEARQRDDRNVIISIDVEIHKAKNQQIGIVFRQGDNSVQIEAILPNTPAVKANLKAGDVLISIEGKKVTTIAQVAKIIKTVNGNVFTLRIERIATGIIRNDAILEDLDFYEDLSGMNMNFSKSTESAESGNPKVLKRLSIDKGTGTSSDSSLSNTPSNSPRKYESAAKVMANRPLVRENSEGLVSLEDSDVGASTRRPSSASATFKEKVRADSSSSVENFQQHSTVYSPVNSFIRMDDSCRFQLDENCNFLNISVYGKYNGDSGLLGYLNIPIHSVLSECSESVSGQHLKLFTLMPPLAGPESLSHPLSAQSGFDPNLCYGDILLSFIWCGCSSTTNSLPSPSSEGASKKTKAIRASTDKLSEIEGGEENLVGATKSHNFIRTHFHRATQCDFCGKKIWLKDAVQCRDCSMCCHKKCIGKCQNSTVCGPVDCSNASTGSPATTITLSALTGTVGISGQQPEFKVTEAPKNDTNNDTIDDNEEAAHRAKLNGHHRQSFSDLLQQGLKRVNSANNLAIPGIVSSLNQSSRSLPPTPQHTPRKQSLVNQSANPFATVTQKLEGIPEDAIDLSKQQISSITETLIGYATAEDLMSLAKTASKSLYSEFQPTERVEKINSLLTKLRIALDSETSSHSALLSTPTYSAAIDASKSKSSSVEHVETKSEIVKPSSDVSLFLQTKPASNMSTSSESSKCERTDNDHELAKRAILVGQSEERVQALSVVMLYLCTGLQHAQGVACQ